MDERVAQYSSLYSWLLSTIVSWSSQQAYAAGPRQGCVVIFHALNADKMNCDRLFNLLCLYGNVERIKFLKTKEGAALVQMGDSVACERVVNNLHGAYAFDSRMQVFFS